MDEGVSFDLPHDEAHHVRNVLRGAAGDTFEAVDSTQRLFTARLEEGRGATVLAEGNTKEDTTNLRLYQAIPKGKHMDLVVEKATELGVAAIVPLITEHGVVKPSDAKKVDRWRRIAEAAARQSLQLRIPEVREPISFPEAARGEGPGGVMLHNEVGLSDLEECVQGSSAGLFVGPEGGWSEGELDLAGQCGISLAQLGPYRLRSETAGIVAVARSRAAMGSTVEKFERSG
ncbi:MAG: RsmE family RNA methyltransferase [Rubrobacteraceae bacterium]